MTNWNTEENDRFTTWYEAVIEALDDDFYEANQEWVHEEGGEFQIMCELYWLHPSAFDPPEVAKRVQAFRNNQKTPQ